MKNIKRTIAIMCGGDSSEYGVSLRSGQGVYSFFDKERYDVYIVVVKGRDWHVELPDGTSVPIDRDDFAFMENGRLVQFDYAYITIHGTPGENGILQGYLETVHIPYSTSGVLVEALTFNKFVFNQYIKSFGVRVPDSLLIRKGYEEIVSDEEIEQRIGMPCFVKPAADGSSFGVSKVKNADQLAPAIRKAMLESEDVMVEQFVDGTEISMGCYKTRDKSVVLPATEVVTQREFFDYDAKYNGQVQEITPARLSDDTAKRVAEITSHIYDILHCNGIIRIDYIISHEKNDNGELVDKVNLIEVNTTPGMTATSFIPQQVRAAGLNMTSVLTDIVENQFR
ncbi:MAG: D-alanine--D-alanine ligase [Prevotella sp.]|nr:D-alanine--D-alanine ligase [Prevotella sp.]